MPKDKQNKVVVVLKKSTIGCSAKQKACVQGLGLRKMHHRVELVDTPEVRGMINKVSFLLNVETI